MAEDLRIELLPPGLGGVLTIPAVLVEEWGPEGIEAFAEEMRAAMLDGASDPRSETSFVREG